MLSWFLRRKEESVPRDTSDDRLKFALEAWKTAIDVQKHFNTIEMQIRSIAITVLTTSIGAAAVTYSQAQETAREAIKAGVPVPATGVITIFGVDLPAAGVIILAGMFAWLAFYFMDRWWYHRLLQGAVAHAEHIEEKMEHEESVGDLMSLSKQIRAASAFKLFGIVKVRTNQKIDLFYGTILVVLIVIMVFAF